MEEDYFAPGEKLTGTLAVKIQGFAFFTPTTGEDVFIPKVGLNGALNGDRVEIVAVASSTPGRSREGAVLSILEHANTKIVGTYDQGSDVGLVTPDDPLLRREIIVPTENALGAKTGMKVVVTVTRWPDDPKEKLRGVVSEVLGVATKPGVDILAIMRRYDLWEEFPPEVQGEVECLSLDITQAEVSRRLDRRNFPVVTIDGEDAKDLDDGVYAAELADGHFFLGVYIADVSHYVQAHHPLDKEAAARGTSVYLADRVVPMLPKELSNGICSLNAGEDRLAMACEAEISPSGEVVNYTLREAVIRVKRRLTYNTVNKILTERDETLRQDQADIVPMLEILAKLRQVLKGKREERGAVDFNIPEIKVILNKKGKAVGLKKRLGSLGESIIEECMLTANEIVAEHLCRRQIPSLYRVHEEPQKEKIQSLNDLLATFGLYLRRDEEGKISPGDLQKALREVKGRPEDRIISMVALRSMQQARYAAENLGHFGLAAAFYTHFTSPIRRYPDLMVHRLLKASLRVGGIPQESQEKLRRTLPEIALLASQRERIAVEAERETTALKVTEYMARFVGEEFTGIISGVTSFGLFVELENGVEGLVPMTSLVDDYYVYVESQFALIGEVSRRVYRLGDEATVILLRANLDTHSLDFIMKDNTAYDVNSLHALKKAKVKVKKGKVKAGLHKKPKKRGEVHGKEKRRRKNRL
ncbi:MAG: ribonuclease R [Selenomonadaceae bacterium]|nr:ribonuclease R [Selenomonadaceae bacterium]